MKSVFEFAARHIEPSLKKSLVHKLLARGVERSAIRKCLGISPSLISRYSKGERGLHDFTMMSDVNTALENLADRIASGRLRGADAYVEISRLTLYILLKKYACGIHHLVSKDVNPTTCSLCLSLFEGASWVGNLAIDYGFLNTNKWGT